MQNNEKFTLVTHGRKRAPRIRDNNQSNVSTFFNTVNDSEPSINYDKLLGNQLEAETELKNSLIIDSVLHHLKDSLVALKVSGISDILCYGLGNFSICKISMYQLALLSWLKKHYGSQVHIYDPVFFSEEVKLLEELGCNIIKVNEEGKRSIDDNITLVYMPHCAMHLTNNFLYANWCQKLNKCILLTNSFSLVVDNLIGANMSSSVDYIIRIQPYATEFKLKYDDMYDTIFNDLSIHIFLEKTINMLPESFWNQRDEPCYQNRQIDYISAKETEEIDNKRKCV